MENLDKEISIAYKDWQQAINVFNNAVTKEDIDFAIYNLETKKRHYLRLHAMAKRQNQTDESLDFE